MALCTGLKKEYEDFEIKLETFVRMVRGRFGCDHFHLSCHTGQSTLNINVLVVCFPRVLELEEEIKKKQTPRTRKQRKKEQKVEKVKQTGNKPKKYTDENTSFSFR